jgi:hypothetical protein
MSGIVENQLTEVDERGLPEVFKSAGSRWEVISKRSSFGSPRRGD